jgi:hypothetical protein
MNTRHGRTVGWIVAALSTGLVGMSFPFITYALVTGPVPEGSVAQNNSSFEATALITVMLLSFLFVEVSICLPAWVVLGGDLSAGPAIGCLMGGLFVLLIASQGALVVSFRLEHESTVLTDALGILVPYALAASATSLLSVGLRRSWLSRKGRAGSPADEEPPGR